ncbi:MAG TPA: gliding motility-associated ABC transporter substrate-binding protein GldG [Cyclobacteriaceae bacterium]|nr:gliding motility-associated ABC transporter substrate-binding protein GldG [Cyclobacteriaceae bacterium]
METIKRPMRSWKQSRQLGDCLLLANGIVFVVLVNLMASSLFFRIDLTEEKRYTIRAPTKKLLRDLDDHVYIEVFLEGDLNPGFRRFRKSVGETLEEFRIYSNNKVHYTFTDPALAMSDKARNEFMAGLASKGVHGMRVIDKKGGERTEKIVFPGALLSYNGFENGVMLLKGSRLAVGSQEVLNQSIEGIEFEFANAIQKLTNTGRKRVGLLRGHGELDSLSIAGLNNALLEQYDVFNVDLPRKKEVSHYDVLIVPKPVKPFSEADKFKLDQYIMTGGNVIFLIDRQDAVMDSASRNNYYAFPIEVNLDDQLFKYGVRINRDLIQDRVAGKYPVVVGEAGGRPQLMPLDWPWFPLINHYADHPITRNLDATLTRFISSMDTVKAIGVKKTALLFTSSYSRKATIPVKIDINDVRKELKREDFQEGPIPVAYLLEGEFTSLYKNRFFPAGVDTSVVAERSKPAKIIVVADGDVARNDVNPRSGQAQALGLDLVSGYTFANQDLLLNMVAYLVEENGVISARNKEVKIRPLDKERIRNRSFWQVVNLVLPVLVLILFGLGRMWRRKRKYTSF